MRIRPSTALSLATRPSFLTRASSRTQSLPSEVLHICQDHLPTYTRLQYSTSPSPAPVPASQLQFGQPVHETHPHILAPGELTPSITAQEYHDRRTALASSLPTNALAILPSSSIQWRSGAVFHPFRQNSNFLYLTGFSEPESLAVIQKTGPQPDDFLFHLYVRPKNPSLEQWSGPWSGVQAAQDVFNADVADDIAQSERLLSSLLQSASKIYTDADLPSVFPNTRRRSAQTVAPLKPLLNALRIVKSPSELAAMRHAGKVSGRALTSAMRREWTHEKDLATYLNHAFTADGLDGPAYVPVVAGGSRANMIHYVQNNQILSRDKLVLVDAGGEYGTYISDITRTWPVNGKFQPAQRDLYEAVLRVQRMGVALCRANNGGLSLDRIHRATEAALTTELRALGFTMDRPADLEGVFAHHVGHYVGLDVHDCPGYGRNVALKKGMCVTIEPGVYVPDDERYPKHFRGMGIRIEDSVAVDDKGPTVLTVEAVKEVVDVEALRN
ncbi:aminopeptidase [Gnomoniopsis smithogilvyi]|uniref:Xaa-Pro aminopeptidase n=1 Tax=Gnomoniopsis smithogilvyi TaxID=1191159 RepID=A0A9W8YVW4_9PEZI|nr:aminopeptidase [Gnomoniopsis smithogilvyi]